MKREDLFILTMIAVSIGYLLYSSLFSDYRYGMMRHHYGYYDQYSLNTFYLNSFVRFIAYSMIVTGVLLLFRRTRKTKVVVDEILETRLAKGEISIDEYKILKSTIKGTS